MNLIKWLKSGGYRIVLLLKVEKISPAANAALREICEGIYLTGDIQTAKFSRKLFFGRHRENRELSPKEAMAPDILVRATKRLCRQYQPLAVIAEYIFTTRCLDHVPNGTLKIIDTHDMFSRKKSLVEVHGIEDPFSCTEEEERNYLLKADLILAIQKIEEAMFKRLVPEKTVITAEIDFAVAEETDNREVHPNTVLVIGSDNPLNVHGLQEFIHHAWLAVRLRQPKATLRIVGKVANHIDSEDPSIERLGWVADLGKEYRRAELVINPTVAGTGLKIKSVEALCQGKALVGTPNSVDGLLYDGDAPFVVAKNWSEFSERILCLLEDEISRKALQRRALEYSRGAFCPEKVYSSLAAALGEFEATLRDKGRMA